LIADQEPGAEPGDINVILMPKREEGDEESDEHKGNRSLCQVVR
jgi:hypothetical protein